MLNIQIQPKNARFNFLGLGSPILTFAFFALLLIGFGCKPSKTAKSKKDKNKKQNDTEEAFVYPIEQTEYKATSPYRAMEEKKWSLIHTKLRVKFDWEKQQLMGTEIVSMTPQFFPQDSLVLDAKAMLINKVALVANDADLPGKELSFDYSDSLNIKIDLGRTYKKGEALELYIDYVARPEKVTVKGSAAITADKGLYFINPLGEDTSKPRQIWTQGETEASSCWFPTIDAPNQKTTQEIYMTVDTAFVTLSNGLLIDSETNSDGTRTDHWKQSKPHVPYLFMMAVGDFAIVKDKWRDMDVHYYVEREYEDDARAVFGNTPEMIEFFSQKLGYDYPWEKYHSIVVRDFVSGAMENTTASLFMEAVQITKRETIDKTWDGIVAHELFHHWFGDLVTCESWSNLPLNESFANYSEYLWFEHHEGRDYADMLGFDELNQYLAESENKKVDLVRFYYKDKEDMFDSHSYAKGGRVLHMLRKYLGDEAFFASLGHYLKTNEFQSVEIHDLRLAFEDVTGKDLNWFFNQWFLENGHPKLKVSKEYADGKVKLYFKQEQDTILSPIYKLPLAVDVWTSSSKKSRHLVTVDDLLDTVVLPAAQKPLWVHVDAEEQLLGEMDYELTEEEYMQQFMLSELYMPKYRSMEYFGEKGDSATAEKILGNALNDEFFEVRRMAVETIDKLPPSQQEAFLTKLQELALKDPNSKVRAKAVGFFGTMGYAQINPEIFDKGLQDSSYMVNAMSLVGYFMTNGKEKTLEKLGDYEDVPNVEIIKIVGEFYGAMGATAKIPWFLNTITQNSGEIEFHTVNNLAYMFSSVETDEEIMMIADLLQGICRSEETWKYSKYAAYRGLTQHKDHEYVKPIMDSIYEDEDQTFIKNLYERLR